MLRVVGFAILQIFLTILAAGPSLDSAIEHYEFGELEKAKSALSALLDPIQLKGAEQIVKARQYLGATHYLLGDVDAAEREFVRLLNMAPNHDLDAAVFSPEIVRFFESVRRKIEPAPKPKPEPEKAPPRQKPPGEPVGKVELAPAPQNPPLALAFIPFGVGQLNNDRPVKGALFLGGEVALFATALTTFAMFKSKCTEAPDGSCRVDPAQQDDASTLQTVALATFYTGLGVTVLGIVEALIDYPGKR